ncbi:MAG TPA: hypothetical protein ENK04_09370 [Gammaproteobacteria bacterium]|nr:hypothetical protein [Gammaproteobacteria bacterium]
MKNRLFLCAAVLGCLLLLSLDGANAAPQPALAGWVGTVPNTNPRARAAQSALDAAQARERVATLERERMVARTGGGAAGAGGRIAEGAGGLSHDG